ncbi:MAG: GNAT family N-acetyltransferase, partial [Nocardioidaceae bacterium]
METRRIDPRDEALNRQAWEVGKAADEHGRPWATYLPWGAARVAFVPNEAFDQWTYVAVGPDVMIGAARCLLPLLDNTGSAYLDLYVLPDQRQRGVGTTLLERVLTDLVREGRETVTVEVSTPSDEGPSPGLRFAERHGFTVGILDDHRVVDLAATRGRWVGLAEDCAPHHSDYRLVTWHDVVPAEHVDGYCALQRAFNSEAPAGELDLEAEHWDEQRVRGKEERFRRAGRHEVVTAAVAPDGSLAGLTEVM